MTARDINSANTVAKPNFFIVGAPKCGTTAMYEYLKAHPEIFMPDVKEPVFFGTQKTRDLASYLAIFSPAKNQKMIGEASPSYLASEDACKEIFEFDPAAKIIIMLRSPIDVIYSAYYQSRASGRENIMSFEEALNEGENRLNMERLPDGDPRPIYRSYVRFSGSVQRYFNRFGRNNVHIIIYDDLQKDTAAVYRRTLEFLGVDPDFRPEFKVVNPSKQVRSLKLQKLLLFFRLSPHELKRSKLGAVGRLIPAQIRQMLFKPLRNLYLVEKRPPPLDPDLKRRLQEEFLSEVQQLSELLGRDLTHWCRD
jgi:hypothetical protein